MHPRGNWATCGKRKSGQFVHFYSGNRSAPTRFALSPEKGGKICPFFTPQSCISCAMVATESIRGELQQQLRTLLGDRVYFAASAPAPHGWLQNPRVQQLLHDLISALSTQLQVEAVGVEAQGFKAEAERLRARARAISELRFSQWHMPEVQQQLWRLVWGV